MKTKITSIVMITVVSIIWVLITYKVYDTYFKEEKNEPREFSFSTEQVQANSSRVDSFELNLDYPDPFLKGIRVKKSKVSLNSTVKVQSQRKKDKELKPKLEVVFPDIVYLGNMINTSSSRISAIILVNKKEFLVSGGEVIDDIEIIAVDRSSILVKKDLVTKTFDLQQHN